MLFLSFMLVNVVWFNSCFVVQYLYFHDHSKHCSQHVSFFLLFHWRLNFFWPRFTLIYRIAAFTRFSAISCFSVLFLASYVIMAPSDANVRLPVCTSWLFICFLVCSFAHLYSELGFSVTQLTCRDIIFIVRWLGQ